MGKIKPLDRQSLLDMAIQESGGIEAVMELSIRNDIAVSQELDAMTELEAAAIIDSKVVNRYQLQRIRPATEVTAEEMAAVPYGGIGFMGVEVDFIVS